MTAPTATDTGRLREAIRDEVVAYRSVTFDPYVIADRLLTLPEVAALIAERDRYAAQVQAVRELHASGDCTACNTGSDGCITIRALGDQG